MSFGIYQGTKHSGGTPELAITCCYDDAQIMKETAEFERNVLFCMEYLSQPIIK
jgi:hypothetical protein